MFRQAPASQRDVAVFGGYGPTCLYCNTAVAADLVRCPRCDARKGTRGDVGLVLRIVVWSSTAGPASWYAYHCIDAAWREARYRTRLGDMINIACAVLAVLIAYGIHRLYRRMFGTAWDPVWFAS